MSKPGRHTHGHNFADDTTAAERRTRLVIIITVTMMIVEIIAGTVFQSMALLADGWHMSTHVAAFLITAIAYAMSRRRASDPSYTFGTGKIGVLGGFTSAVVLGVVAFLIAAESVHRIVEPLEIRFDEAIGVAVLGLLVNLVCAGLLHDSHDTMHAHDHHHGPVHGDLNRRAAYVHVLADALTSVMALLALVCGKFFGWTLMDPVVGILGSFVVASWAVGLMRQTSGILLDRTPSWSDLPGEIRKTADEEKAAVCDLHVWQVAPGKFAAIIAIDTDDAGAAGRVRERLREHEELVHVTVEVHPAG